MKKTGRTKKERLPKQVLSELAAIGLTRATDVLQLGDGQILIKQPEQMKPEYAAAIAAVEKTAGGWKVKFYDKLKALELLGTYMGLFGSQSSRKEEPCNLLEAILASTREVMDTGDLQELQQTTADGDDLVEQTGLL